MSSSDPQSKSSNSEARASSSRSPDSRRPNNRSTSDRLSQKRRNMDPELYARLQAEAKAPYRGLRRFLYVAFGASGLIGGFIFLAQIASGQGDTTVFSNLAIQIGVVGLMIFLLRIDCEKK